MKNSTKKVVALGCGLPIVFILLSILLLFYQTHKKLEYSETGYGKDYMWNGIEIGTVIRFPENTTIPIGRYGAVIAFADSTNRSPVIFPDGEGTNASAYRLVWPTDPGVRYQPQQTPCYHAVPGA